MSLWISYHPQLKKSSKLVNAYLLFFRAHNTPESSSARNTFFSYLRPFLLSSLFLGLAPGSRCQEPHGASMVSEGCRDTRPALSAGSVGWFFLQLNQGRTFLLLPKDSPPLGGFSQGQVGWQHQETVPTCCETRAIIC